MDMCVSDSRDYWLYIISCSILLSGLSVQGLYTSEGAGEPGTGFGGGTASCNTVRSLEVRIIDFPFSAKIAIYKHT